MQIPSQSGISGGQPKFIKPFAAASVGIDALFLEIHPGPKNALSDAATQLPLEDAEALLRKIKQIDDVVKHR
ncbi:MAG: hypothetical protein HYV28_08650 [Ignavibacteriales bacterium]|nr:hypothetical protein [Ignavibacteriales bacterium]